MTTPEREGGGGVGGVAAGLMGGGVSGRPSSPWHTPTPYLFLGFALVTCLIVVALLVLICTTTRSEPPRRGGAAARDDDASSARVLVPLHREPKVAVVMAGDRAPSFLASAKPLAAFVPNSGGAV